MSRLRERDDVKPLTVRYQSDFGPVDFTYPVTTVSYYEFFIDSTDPSVDIHPCDHARADLAWQLGSYSFTNEYGHHITVSPYSYGAPAMGRIGDLFPHPSSVLLADFADEAYEKLTSQVPQEVSLPNFLYEFREIGSLIPSLGDSMAKTVSGGFLNYSFGWKPLIGDIQKLNNLMQTVRARIEYLKFTYGRETRLTHSKSFEVEGDSMLQEPNGDRLYRDSSRGLFVAGGYLFHMLNELDGLEGTLRAAAGALGLNNPLAVVWEAIPFSFVLDWFGRIQSRINRMAVQPFTGEWSIRKLCYSYRINGTWRKNLYLGPGCTPERVDQIKGTWQQYVRNVGLPVSDSLLSSTALDPRQQLLSAALIHQTVRH